MGNIYLVGFMGTGKTVAGKELARRLKWQFMDLDDLIELTEKRSIHDIFSQQGEAHFRRLEKRALSQVSRENKFVVACGGGIVIDQENVKIMKETGLVICLSAAPDVILKRTGGYSHRPLLNVPDPEKQIELLLKLRASYYARADKTIDTSRLSLKQVVERIVKLVRGKTKIKTKKKK